MLSQIVAFDKRVARRFAKVNMPALNAAAALFGRELTLCLLFTGTMCWLVFVYSFSLFGALRLGVFLLLLEAAVWTLKVAFKRARPADSLTLPDKLPFYPRNPSMPSGVAADMGYFATLLSAAYPEYSWGIHAVALAVSALRLYSGAHFFSDVTAGYALGCIAGTVALAAAPQPV